MVRIGAVAASSCPEVRMELIGLLILVSSVISALVASYVRDEIPTRSLEEREELRPAA